MIDDATFTQVVRRPKRALFMGLCWEAWLRPPNLIVSQSVQADTEAKQRSEKAGMKREWDETWWIEACPRDADGETFPLSRLCFFITPSSQNDNRSQQRQNLLPFYSSSALKLSLIRCPLCRCRICQSWKKLYAFNRNVKNGSKTEHGDDMKPLNIETENMEFKSLKSIKYSCKI